jgi:hypothetical protein
MSSSELLSLIVNMLVRAHGGAPRRWRRAVGPIKVYSRTTHAHCNWDVRSSGSIYEVACVEAMVDTVRSSRPFVIED